MDIYTDATIRNPARLAFLIFAIIADQQVQILTRLLLYFHLLF